MDFKIEITCHGCKCKFQLRPINFSDKNSLSCPNCGNEIDGDIFSHLRTGVKELSLVPDIFPEDSAMFSLDYNHQPRFSFEVKEYNQFFKES